MKNGVRSVCSTPSAAARVNPAQELLDCLFDAATRFAGAAPQHDDMTLVVLRAFAVSAS